MEPASRIQDHLIFLYGKDESHGIWTQLEARLENFKQKHPKLQGFPTITEILTEKDAILITYGDQIQKNHQPHLKTLTHFFEKHLKPLISSVHILPFFPYSSDDGFSVIDYTKVDPQLGSWEDIARLSEHSATMFDAVINHISRQSKWFQGYLKGQEPYTDYFISVDPNTDLSQVVRPRALPLLTPVETSSGQRHVWTTFSDDQIDLNFANPLVLLEIIDILLYYVEQGASIIRLDAIAFLWKEIGTSCIHLPQTHHVIKLFRAVLDVVAPGVILISETNVPHEENISYFGKPLSDVRGDEASQRGDEAQMVYQFPLAPLILHTFLTGDARVLTKWAASLETPYPSAMFFNFIASHDGIGVRPAEGLLTPQEIQALVDNTLAHGGRVSYKTNSDGSQSAYELNITLYDALNDPDNPQTEMDVKRFLASQAIMLSLAGVPGIYVHSLFGSRNCYECLADTGRARSINRHKFQLDELESALNEPDSITSQIFSGYAQLLGIRQKQPEFHPYGGQWVLDFDPAVFSLLRTSLNGESHTLCLHNVSNQTQTFPVDLSELPIAGCEKLTDPISGTNIPLIDSRFDISMQPFQVAWLQA